MFAHIEGTVAEKNADSIVLDVHGVGFLLTVSGATLAAAPAAGERMKLYTVLNVREDAMELFGFYSREEKRMYERLRGVSGVGSRMAMQVLSGMSLRDLSVALAAGDVHALTRIPGIGKKTAQRLVLEALSQSDRRNAAHRRIRLPHRRLQRPRGRGRLRADRAGLHRLRSGQSGRAGRRADGRRQPDDLPRPEGQRFRRRPDLSAFLPAGIDLAGRLCYNSLKLKNAV